VNKNKQQTTNSILLLIFSGDVPEGPCTITTVPSFVGSGPLLLLVAILVFAELAAAIFSCLIFTVGIVAEVVGVKVVVVMIGFISISGADSVSVSGSIVVTIVFMVGIGECIVWIWFMALVVVGTLFCEIEFIPEVRAILCGTVVVDFFARGLRLRWGKNWLIMSLVISSVNWSGRISWTTS
jgi:hypothetical protein